MEVFFRFFFPSVAQEEAGTVEKIGEGRYRGGLPNITSARAVRNKAGEGPVFTATQHAKGR